MPTIETIKPNLNYSIEDTCTVLGISRRKFDYMRKKAKIKSYVRGADDAVRVLGREIIKFYNS